ncbi:MAG: hypothetical protein ACI4KR_07755 [Ruminiclostridium sp.]
MDLKITPKKPDQLEKERVKKVLTETSEQAKDRAAMSMLADYLNQAQEIAKKETEEFKNSVRTVDKSVLNRGVDYINWLMKLGADVEYAPQITGGQINMKVAATFPQKVKFSGDNFSMLLDLMNESTDFHIYNKIKSACVEIHYTYTGVGRYMTNK